MSYCWPFQCDPSSLGNSKNASLFLFPREQIKGHATPSSNAVRITLADTLGLCHERRHSYYVGRFYEEEAWYDAYFKELTRLKTLGDEAAILLPVNLQV